jgi:glycosyltransferase involved in cell wall biosynthesis
MTLTDAPLISVIIPTYNHARYLGRALQSVLDQTFSNWEIIIVDNHSTDNTDELVASFADSRTTYLKVHNHGVIAKSRNMGVRAAKGEWIAFLDSDDWWSADKLKVWFDCVSDKVDLVYHDLEIVNAQPRSWSRKKNRSGQVQPPVLTHLLLGGNAISNSSVVVRKSLLEKIGGIDESAEMIAAEDYNAWLRIAQLTDRFVYLPHRLGYYFVHSQGISKRDMAVPARRAVAEFMPMLSALQTLKVEANFAYTTGHFNYFAGNYPEARSDLYLAVKQGFLMTKVKSAILLCMLVFKQTFVANGKS